jgi:RecJ-like exonuclease
MAATQSYQVVRGAGGRSSAPDSVDELMRRITQSMGHDRFKLSADAGKLHVTEAPCAACNGEGSILLLVSRRPCRRCGGTGLFSASVDFPLTGVRVEQFCQALRERQA